MEIQEVITALSNLAILLADIKMEKVRGEITEREAKTRCAALIKKEQAESIISQAVKEWEKWE